MEELNMAIQTVKLTRSTEGSKTYSKGDVDNIGQRMKYYNTNSRCLAKVLIDCLIEYNV